MINFNFAEAAQQVSITSTGGTRLKANQIHKVVCDKCEVREIDTKNGKMKILSFVFADKDGLFYEDTIFEPTSTERKANSFGGVNPSSYDLFMTKIRLYAKTFAPKLYDMLNANKFPATNSWESLITTLCKAYQEGVTAKIPFQIKLMRKPDGWATLPTFFLTFNQKNELYIKNKFIASENETLEFSAKELEKISKEEALVPTKMTDIPAGDTVFVTGSGVPQTQVGGAPKDELSSLLAQF